MEHQQGTTDKENIQNLPVSSEKPPVSRPKAPERAGSKKGQKPLRQSQRLAAKQKEKEEVKQPVSVLADRSINNYQNCPSDKRKKNSRTRRKDNKNNNNKEEEDQDSENTEESTETKATRENKETGKRKAKSLKILCTKFIQLCSRQGKDKSIGLDAAVQELDVEKRRIYDVVNVLESINIVGKIAKNTYRWIGLDSLPSSMEKLKSLSTDIPNEKEKEGKRKDRSLGVLCQKFLRLFFTPEGGGIVTLEDAAKTLIKEEGSGQNLKTKIRRLYDIANILSSIHLIEKVQLPQSRKPCFKWVYDKVITVPSSAPVKTVQSSALSLPIKKRTIDNYSRDLPSKRRRTNSPNSNEPINNNNSQISKPLAFSFLPQIKDSTPSRDLTNAGSNNNNYIIPRQTITTNTIKNSTPGEN